METGLFAINLMITSDNSTPFKQVSMIIELKILSNLYKQVAGPKVNS